jgi:hypothetical protein
MPRDQKELGNKLSSYADAITAFTFVQSAAFAVALGSSDIFPADVVKGRWLVPLAIIVANVLYAFIVHTCHRGEDALLGPSVPPVDVWENKVRIGRMSIIGLGLLLSLGAFTATCYGSRHSPPPTKAACPMKPS